MHIMFGEFLLSGKHISPEQLKNALSIMLDSNKLFGELARKINNLTTEQVMAVLKNMNLNSKRYMEKRKFGEIASELGFLSEGEVQTIMEIQNKSNKRIGEIMVAEGYLTETSRDELLAEYLKLKES